MEEQGGPISVVELDFCVDVFMKLGPGIQADMPGRRRFGVAWA